jgi:hypothetical protein
MREYECPVVIRVEEDRIPARLKIVRLPGHGLVLFGQMLSPMRR